MKAKIKSQSFLENEAHAADIMEGVKQDLASHIRQQFHELGYTQCELAEKVHMSQSDISRILNGLLQNKSFKTLVTVLRELGVDVEFDIRYSKLAK